MAGKIRVQFGRPQHGWLELRVGDDRHLLELTASAVPRDSVGEIAGAISLLLKGGPAATVSWNSEPAEHDFRFVVDGEEVCLTVSAYPDSTRTAQTGTEVLSLMGSKLEICLPFWRALRRLESLMPHAEYEVAWGHRFPETKLREITALVERAKQGKD